MGYLGNNPKGNLLTMNSSQFSGDNSKQILHFHKLLVTPTK